MSTETEKKPGFQLLELTPEAVNKIGNTVHRAFGDALREFCPGIPEGTAPPFVLIAEGAAGAEPFDISNVEPSKMMNAVGKWSAVTIMGLALRGDPRSMEAIHMALHMRKTFDEGGISPKPSVKPN